VTVEARLRHLWLGINVEQLSTNATGTGWETTPWHATQRAAWAALRKTD